MAEEEILYQGQPSVVGSLGRFLICIFTLGLGYLWFWIRTRHIKYLITSQRVVVERGIFNRIIDTIELYRMDDIELTKPFSQRLSLLAIACNPPSICNASPSMSGSYTKNCARTSTRQNCASNPKSRGTESPRN